MNNMRVESQNFVYNFVLPAQKLWDISEVEGHYYYEQKGGRKFFFKRREFPSLKTIQEESARNILAHTTESLQNQLAISQAGLSKYIMRYHSVIISYPYACFIHQPFLDNLSNFMKNSLSFEEKVDLMMRIARGVDDLHSKNICIRTLRPSTIILMENQDEKYSIVFSDVRNIGSLDKEKKFGLSQIKETNPYMAPELIKEGNLSLSCDIWSLGLVYYEIFFTKKINFQRLEQVGVVEFPQGSSRWVQNFLEKMIIREPKNRYNIKDIIRFLKNANLCSKLSKNCLC